MIRPALAAAAAALAWAWWPAAAERAVPLPQPKLDARPTPGLQTAVFAGGCF